MKYWQSRGAVIKLVGYSARSGETVTSCVIPVGCFLVNIKEWIVNKEENKGYTKEDNVQCVVPLSNPLSSVHYADNIIQLSSKDMRDVSVIGSVGKERKKWKIEIWKMENGCC